MEETLSFLVIAYEPGFIPEHLYMALRTESKESSKILNGYIAYIKKVNQALKNPEQTTSPKKTTVYFSKNQ